MTRETAAFLLAVGGPAAGLLAASGVAAFVVAVVNERRMQRHRLAGVSYGTVTFRRDGGWRREDLFTAEGLAFQRRASEWGVIGSVLFVAAIAVLWLIGLIPVHGLT